MSTATDATAAATATATATAAAKRPSKEEKEVCSICADTYTAVLRRKITCTFCNKDACTKCIEYYLLSRPEDAHCIHCRVNYSDTILKSICTRTYLQKTYYRHRQEVLIRRERVSLPGLQEDAQRAKRQREYMAHQRTLQAELTTIKSRRTDLIIQHTRLYSASVQRAAKGEDTKQDKARIEEIYDEIQGLNREIKTKKQEIRQASRLRRWGDRDEDEDGDGNEDGNGNGDGNGDGEEKKEEKKKFIRRCMKAGCQGFLSTAWKCGLCENYSCGKCFTVKGPAHDTPHECAKDDLATADMIRKDSKPCPSCGEYIEKTVGCSMMFCITCKTPWDWNTGKIVTKGVIHNPHYYEWLKRTGGGEAPRNPADVPCGGFPGVYELRAINRNASSRCAQYFYEFHRICMEIQDQTERQFRSHLDEGGMRGAHICFLLGDFDEKEWGRRLAQAEKKRKRDAEIQEVFAAFRMVAVELLNRIQHYRDPMCDAFTLLPRDRADAYLEGWHREVLELVKMVNEGLKAISLSYGCCVPFLSVEQRMISDMPLHDYGRYLPRITTIKVTMSPTVYYRVLSRKWTRTVVGRCGSGSGSGNSSGKKKAAKEEEEEQEEEDLSDGYNSLSEEEEEEEEEKKEEAEQEEQEQEEQEQEQEEEVDVLQLAVAISRSLVEK